MTPANTEPSDVLTVNGLSGGYGALTVVRDVSLNIPRGHIHALIGANGAGKTTLLKLISGLLPARHGTVSLASEDVTTAPTSRRARAGLCLVPEGRGIFPSLTVKQNLTLQARRGDRGEAEERAFAAFPPLRRLLNRRAGTLSGGEQQMLALSRCFVTEPTIVLLDEVSMGLAPIVVDEIFASLNTLAESGVALLLVEQYIERALAMAQTAQVMTQGVITYSGSVDGLDAATLMRDYLGASDDQDIPRPFRGVADP